jgi:membrane fusion protein, heavy metal efflux system
MSTRRFGARAYAPKMQALIIAVLVLVTALGFGGALIGRTHDAVKSEAPSAMPNDAANSFRPTPLQWASLNFQSVQTVSFRTEVIAEGNIAVNDDTTTPVFSPYSGRVARLAARPGDVIKKGAPLFFVEATENVQAQNDLATALAALSTTKSQLALAEKTEKRQHDLYDARAGALKDWLQSQADLITAKNAAETAEIGLAAVRNRLHILGKSDTDIDGLERAAVDHRMVSEAPVLAPISGIVTQRQVGAGQYIASVTGGATLPLYVLGDLSSVWLVANVRESDARYLKVGQPVEVRVAAYPDRRFSAKIAWVAPMLDPATHRLPVRAVIDNRDGTLKPLMFASFSIAVSDAASSPAVPKNAVVYEGDTVRVWVARDDQTVTARRIQTGREHAGMIEILGGVAAGEKVVASGTLFIDRAAKSGDQGGEP